MGAKTVLAERCDATIRGIEETRRRISDKAGLLQSRLTPKAVLRPVTKRLQGTLGEGGEKILDTFRDEPLQPTSPFYDLSNVIVTPHTAWSSGRVVDRSVELFCDNLRRYAAGEPLLNVVDPAAGY